MSESQMSERVGFIGLGNMGGPLAERLVTQTKLAVFDLDPVRTEPFINTGAVAAGSLTELGSQCSMIFTCLPSSHEVKSAIFGDGGLAAGLAPGSMIVDMTTGNPAMTREMAAELAPRDIALIDAPVSGGPRGAREGTIAIMAGGDETQFARVSPVLRLISSNVIHAGPLGAGHAIKAGNNLLNLICRMATFEVVSMLVKDGVDPATAVAIIQKSSGRNYATEITLPDNILSGTMKQGFTTALMLKDSGVALEIAERLGLQMPLGSLARGLLAGVAQEHGRDADMSAVALTYERLTGARIRPESGSG